MSPSQARTTDRRTPAVPDASWQLVWGTRLLAVSPVCFLPFALDRFGWIALAVALVGAAFALSDRRIPGLARPVAVALGAGLTVAFLAMLVSAAPWQAVLGRAPRFEGLPVLGGYALCLLAGARALHPDALVHTRKPLEDVLAGAICAAALVSLVELAGWQMLAVDMSRSGGLLGNATALGLAGALLAPLLAQAAATRRTPLAVAGAVAALVCVVVSGSRGALLGTVVALAVLAWGVPALRRIVGGGLAALAVAALALPSTRERLLGLSPWSGQTVRGRWELWHQAVGVVADHPVLGVGPSGFAEAAIPHRTAAFYQRFGVDAPADSPHNLVLQVAVAGGVLGLIAACALAVVVVRQSARIVRAEPADGLRWALVAGLTAYAIGLLTHFTTPNLTPLAAFLLGGLCLTPRGEPAERPGRYADTARTAAVSLAAALALFGFVSSLAEIPLRSATVHVLAGDLDAAQASYDEAAQLRPWDPSIPAAALRAYLAAGRARPETAEATAVMAGLWVRDVDRRDESARSDLIDWESQYGDAKAALVLARTALRTDPHNPLRMLQTGILLAEAGEHDAAEQLFLDASEVVPDSPDPWRNLAVLYGLTGDEEGKAAATRRADDLSGR